MAEQTVELIPDAKRTALVVIDLQNALMGVSTAPHAVADVVKNNRRIAEALRAAGGTVIWVRVDVNNMRNPPADEPSRFGGRKMPDELTQIAPSAGFTDGDLLVTKYHWGAFAQTDLESQLRTHGAELVILTGISTNAGVESTLRQGTGLGFAFIVVEDACSGQDAADHRFAFEKTFRRLARVRSTDEVVSAIG
jgi:nicotinamidase-related amidase